MTERHAIRALLLAPDESLLLMKIRVPRTTRTIWITPGGGRQPEEDDLDCLQRELFEETGLREATIGPHVWRRVHELVWDGRPVRQREHYYLVRTDAFEATATHMPHGDDERQVFQELRWWPLAEIARSDELFVPRELARHLHDLIEHGPPTSPIRVGI